MGKKPLIPDGNKVFDFIFFLAGKPIFGPDIFC